MSLSDRLAHARPQADEPVGRAGPAKVRKAHPTVVPLDPFAELKRTVHTALLEKLGPKLYDADSTDLEQ
jgi:pilus assembly protein CpaF